MITAEWQESLFAPLRNFEKSVNTVNYAGYSVNSEKCAKFWLREEKGK